MKNVIDFSAADYVGDTLHTAKTLSRRGKAQNISLNADAVIVGSGPGGMVTALVLAEAGLDVVIIEDGRYWPLGSFKRNQSFATKHLYQDRGTRFMTGNAFIPLTSGRGVGGGTLINSAICFRGPDTVLDEWVRDWGLDHFRPEFRDALYNEVERDLGVAPTNVAIAGENSFVAQRGFAKLGISADFMPRSTPGCAGCGTCQTGCPTGAKSSTDLIWLPRVLRAGGSLYAESRVEEIIMKNGRAVGVRARTRNDDTDETIANITVHADRVILAAGAVNTPLLLLAQNLANSSGQVGKNLRVHPTAAVVSKFKHDIRLWSGATQGYFARHPDDPEILLETFSVPPEAFITQAAAIGVMDLTEAIRDFRHVAACGLLIRDHSSGRITRASDGKPKIAYQVGHHDRQKLSKGLFTLVDMFFAAEAHGVMPVLRGSRFFDNAHEAHEHIRKVEDPADMNMYASHPMGSCRIGADPKNSVARARDGRCHDVEGLYITDSSLFPSALGANPQMTIMAQSFALARNMIKDG